MWSVSAWLVQAVDHENFNPRVGLKYHIRCVGDVFVLLKWYTFLVITGLIAVAQDREKVVPNTSPVSSVR